jgi:hypothetical protein
VAVILRSEMVMEVCHKVVIHTSEEMIMEDMVLEQGMEFHRIEPSMIQ